MPFRVVRYRLETSTLLSQIRHESLEAGLTSDGLDVLRFGLILQELRRLASTPLEFVYVFSSESTYFGE